VNRREFSTRLLFSAVAPGVEAQQPAKVYRIAIVHPSIPVKEMNENQQFFNFQGAVQRSAAAWLYRGKESNR
jgi:hypothetical protein